MWAFYEHFSDKNIGKKKIAQNSGHAPILMEGRRVTQN